MSILYNRIRGNIIEINHDPNDYVIYSLIYRPDVWTANTEFIQDNALVVPTIANGCMYSIAQGGRTGNSEPNPWPTTKNSIISNGTVKFKTLPYSLLLQTGDNIESNPIDNFPASDFILPTGVIIDNQELINGRIVKFRVKQIPLNTNSVTITNRISVKAISGSYTRHDINIILNIVEN
jgi:hypothetical protein